MLLWSNLCLQLGPLVGGLTNKYGCRAVTMCGSVLSAVGVGVSAFAVNINMLIATYGLLAGQVATFTLT